MYGPALFLLVVAYLLINTLLVALGRSLAGLGLIALGLPVYAYYVRRSVTPLRDYWLKSEETVDENQEPLQIGKQIINDYSQDRIGTYD